MNSRMERLTKGLVMTLSAQLLMACSEVGFAPTDPIDAFSIAGGQKETFTFNDDGSGAKVDVLFIVDNSGSMLGEQIKLSSALNSFINSLGFIDWQIAITTTDVSDGTWGIKGSLIPFEGVGVKILSTRVPNFQDSFARTVVRPELQNCDDVTVPCPSGDERPLEAFTQTISKRTTDNAGFFRNGSDTAVVILSDEDERSNGVGAMSPQTVVDTFRAAFGPNKNLSAYGIIIKPGDTDCFGKQTASGGKYGTYAQALADLTGGVTGSICDDDYGPALQNIGNRVREVSRSVTLKYDIDPASLRLVIRPADPALTWSVEGSVLTFSYPPKKGTKIEIFYLPAQEPVTPAP